MTTQIKPLEPLPLEFDEELHQYTWLPTGEVMGTSVTSVLSINKSPRELANIERHKATWQPRGTHVHACLERMLLQQPIEGKTEYMDWIEPLIAHPFWEDFEPIAVEYRVCDLRRGIGGSLDALGIDGFTGRTVLLDLKTQSSSKYGIYRTHPQLGGYLGMLQLHHNIQIDELLTVWARPGECLIGDSQDPDECLQAWEETYAKWEALQERL